MEYYTYAYLREDRTPYYIGKGKKDRIDNPLHNSIHLPPKNRRIFLKQNLTEEESFKHEIYMIDVFGRKDLGTGILHNMTNGGQGVSGRIVSEEQREKMREYHKRVNHKEITPKFFDKENQSKAGKKGGTTTRKNSKGIFSPDYDRTLSAREAGKKGGATQRDEKLGIFAMTDEQKREAGRKGSAVVRSQKWKCKITGYISNPCGLSNYQKGRGINYKDKTLRERIE
jgi:general stress protein YciG